MLRRLCANNEVTGRAECDQTTKRDAPTIVGNMITTVDAMWRGRGREWDRVCTEVGERHDCAERRSWSASDGHVRER